MSSGSRSDDDLREWRCENARCLFRTDSDQAAADHASVMGHSLIRGVKA